MQKCGISSKSIRVARACIEGSRRKIKFGSNYLKEATVVLKHKSKWSVANTVQHCLR